MSIIDFWPLVVLLLLWTFDLHRRLTRLERQSSPPVLIRLPALTASQRRSD